MPEGTFMHAAFNVEPLAAAKYFTDLAKALAGEAAVAAFRNDVRELLGGKDLEEALVPHLGASHGMALAVQDPLVPRGTPPAQAKSIAAVPGIILALELKDPEAAKTVVLGLLGKLIDRANKSRADEHKKMEEELGQEVRPKPRPISLAETPIGAKKAYRLVADGLAPPPLGGAFAPCLVFDGGFLIAASSESALERAAGATETGRGLGASLELARLMGDGTRQVAASSHFSLAGLLDQVARNADLLAANAAPPPGDMKPPKVPTAPTNQEFERYKEEAQQYQQRVAEYRQREARTNGETLKRLLRAARVLGAGMSWSRMGEGSVESVSVWRLELEGAGEAKKE
jgi:hypothetical protein